MNTKNILLGAAIAGIMSASVANHNAYAAGDAAKPAEMGKCQGANSCKAKSDCGTATNSCAGMNSCKGKGWLKTTQDDCKKQHPRAKWEKLEG